MVWVGWGLAELHTPDLKPRVLTCYKLGHCAVLFIQIYDLLRTAHVVTN